MDRTNLRLVLIGAAVALGSALVVFALVFFLGRPALQEGAIFRPGSGPADAPSAGGGPSGGTGQGASSTMPADPGGYKIASTLPPGAKPPQGGASAGEPMDGSQPLARIAYVRDRKLYVSEESGGDEQLVTDLRSGGVYRLSPDRRWIAFASPARQGARTWVLFAGEVGGRIRELGELAADTDISWAPDGKSVAAGFVISRGTRIVNRSLGVAAASGGEPRLLNVSGYDPVFSPDGRELAYLRRSAPTGGGPGELWRVSASGGGAQALTPGRNARSVAWLDQRTLVAVLEGRGSAPDELTRMGSDASKTKLLATSGVGAMRSLHDVLTGSQDGLVAYDLVGDDGYSRIYTVSPSGGAPRLLPGKRDVYPLAWSLDGDRLFYVEGNRSQGEPTAVVSAAPSGLGKTFVVIGGGR